LTHCTVLCGRHAGTHVNVCTVFFFGRSARVEHCKECVDIELCGIDVDGNPVETRSGSEEYNQHHDLSQGDKDSAIDHKMHERP